MNREHGVEANQNILQPDDNSEISDFEKSIEI